MKAKKQKKTETAFFTLVELRQAGLSELQILQYYALVKSGLDEVSALTAVSI